MRQKSVFQDADYMSGFPGLIHPIRRKAVNDNKPSLYKTAFKHAVLMLGVFVGIFLIRSL